MSHGDGFLTLLSIEKGWTHKYTQIKWLWIALAATAGVSFGLLSWLCAPQLLIPACLSGTLVGASVFSLYLKSL